jgi:hypothetical protein
MSPLLSNTRKQSSRFMVRRNRVVGLQANQRRKKKRAEAAQAVHPRRLAWALPRRVDATFDVRKTFGVCAAMGNWRGRPLLVGGRLIFFRIAIDSRGTPIALWACNPCLDRLKGETPWVSIPQLRLQDDSILVTGDSARI